MLVTDAGDEMCWRQIGDVQHLMLVTALADQATNILYLLTLPSGTNIQKISPISRILKPTTENCHQHTLETTISVAPI